MLQPTMPTLKLFPVPIRLPFNWVDVSASGASLAGISRWNQDNQHTSDCSLVVNDQSELIKRPVVCPTSLGLATWLFVKTVANSGQVFKSQRTTRQIRLSYNLLADVVVQPLLKATFTPRKPSEQPSRVASKALVQCYALSSEQCCVMATPNKLQLVKDTVLLDFDSGADVKSLSKKYNAAESSIRAFLKKNERELRGRTDLKQCNDLALADAAYIAGLIDGDGCLTASVGKPRNSTVVNYKLIISMCDEATVQWLSRVTGIGFITGQQRVDRPSWKHLHRYECSGQQLNSLLEKLIPYLRLKKPQALLLQELGDLKKNKIGWGMDRQLDRQIEISRQIQKMNFRGVKLDEVL